MEYSELAESISTMHCDTHLKNCFRRIGRMLFLSRTDLLPDLVKIIEQYERTNREVFGYKQRSDKLARENYLLKEKKRKR